VHIRLKLWENCQASYLFDNGIERLTRVFIGVGHHDVDKNWHQETKEQGTVTSQPGSYGRPRMTEELMEIGLDVGHRRLRRLMRQNGISVVRSHRHMATTDSNHKFKIAPNLRERHFTENQPNQKWTDYIEHVWTREGWLYLPVVPDLHSRRIINWAVPVSPQKRLR